MKLVPIDSKFHIIHRSIVLDGGIRTPKKPCSGLTSGGTLTVSC
jgi:hypothetical protein